MDAMDEDDRRRPMTTTRATERGVTLKRQTRAVVERAERRPRDVEDARER
jgi:hypothetical protein|tara:strand:+ start:419 stop:568 length:150 start_codon:yes stop_codon:yes gene_type:complete